MANEKIKITRIAEPAIHPNESRKDVHYHVFVRDKATGEVTELKETHGMRYFFKSEIERIAFQTGFKCPHAEERLSARTIGCETWGVCFVLQAE